jgi:hypothetical protein
MIDRKVKNGDLLAVPGPSNTRVYPAIQFNNDGSLVAGLRDVCKGLPTHNPWAILNFLVQPESLLDDRKPIDLLRAGEVDLVVQAAKRMGEPGS